MNKLQWNLNQISNIFVQEIAFENVVCKMASILSRPQWVNMLRPELNRWHSNGCHFAEDIFKFATTWHPKLTHEGKINGVSWWRHQMETFSALLAIFFFDLRLNKQLSKQSWGWWYEMPPHPLWRHSNVLWIKNLIHVVNIVLYTIFLLSCIYSSYLYHSFINWTIS